MKDKFFSTPPRDIDELREKIVREFKALREQPAFIQRAVRDVHRRTMLVLKEKVDTSKVKALDYCFTNCLCK